MVHRDEVHGDVRFDRVAVALLDTGPMQRLGRVNQLGFAPLVYRGGNHTRLSHVMGAYHAAGKLVDALRRNYESEARWPERAVSPEEFLPRAEGASVESRWSILRHLVGWAALLHDVGHVPMGHTLEDEFDQIYKKHDDFLSPRSACLWIDKGDGTKPEIRSVFDEAKLLPDVFQEHNISGNDAWRAVLLTCFHRYKRQGNQMEAFKEVLEKARAKVAAGDGAEAERAAGIAIIGELQSALKDLGGKQFFPYMADIVADTICADYLDYLRRDPRNLGLDVLKDDRVASQFWIGNQKKVGMRMALALEDKRGKPRLDTTTGVVDLVRQRYRFAEIVYYHKTKAAASVMFATALRLLEKENFPECPRPDRLVIEPGRATAVLGDLKSGHLPITSFVQRAEPRALLDPEIGDESLMLLMQQRAIEQVRLAIPTRRERALKAGQDERALRGLRALSLLQNLSRRRLHKVVFSLDADTWRDLFKGSGTLASDDLDEKIIRLRGDHQRRSALEHDMQAALADSSGIPAGDDCLLLYIPERKSQAKGIETGALEAGDVITLGQHRAVQAQVAELGQKYASLWRLLVFANPGFNDPLALSRAIDVLLKELVEKLDLAAYQGYDALAKACWFKYVGSELAAAGALYRRVPSRAEKTFELAIARSTSKQSLSDREVAVRAVLLDALRDRKVRAIDARLLLRARFKRDSSAHDALQNRASVRDLFKGENGRYADDIYSGIDRLAHELMKGAGPVLVPRSVSRGRRQSA